MESEIKAGIYVRLSDEDRDKRFAEDESESIQNQKSMLMAYCLKNDWEVFQIYCDEDYSGLDSNRPDFNRMLKDCENGNINLVLCKSQSRFSRDMEIIEKYIHNKFIEWGVRFVSVIDHADSQDKYNKKSRQIMGLTNEWYCEEISENIRSVLKHKREQGQFTGSFAPYGYAVDPENKNHLVVDEPAAKVVRRIFDMYNSGYGYRKIVITLNEEHIPCPLSYKSLNKSTYRNVKAEERSAEGLWTHSTIQRIIKNETYIGNLVQGKSHNISYKNKTRKYVEKDKWIVVRNTHEPIIDTDTWNKAQQRLSDRTRTSPVTKEISLLGGKVKCALCGAAMKRNTYYNKKKTKMYYNLTCGSYKVGAMNCENKSAISGLELERVILCEINKLLDTYYNTEIITEKTRTDGSLAFLKKEQAELLRKVRQAKDKLAKTYDNLLEGIIDKEQYKMFSERYTQEMSELETNLAKVMDKTATLEKQYSDTKNRREVLEKYRHIDVLDRKIVEEFIDTVYIGNKVDGKPRDIKIVWKI